MNMELRFQDSELRVAEDGQMTVSGYVNKTEQLSNVLGVTKRFVEKIAKGAFQRAIDKAMTSKMDIDFLSEHKRELILASTRNGSLELREDEQGLFMTAKISPTSYGKDTYTLIQDQIFKNMSFGFRSVKDSWRPKENGIFERTIEELELYEVSVVRDPAYSQSTISARGINLIEDIEIPAELLKEERDLDEIKELLKSLEERFATLSDEIKEIRSAQEAELEIRKAEAEKKDKEKPEDEESKEEPEEKKDADEEADDKKSEDSEDKEQDDKEKDKDEEDEDEEDKRSSTPSFDNSEFRTRLAALKEQEVSE